MAVRFTSPVAFPALPRLTGLWRHPDFLKLWFGQTVSETGSRISRDGIPVLAVLTLNASPASMGLLTALTALPLILLGLFAGAWVDRLPRRPVMIACDVLRVVLLLTIPLLALSGSLSFPWVCGVAMLNAILSMVFDLAYRAALPDLIAREHLLEGNTKLAVTESLAEIGGPALAGVLIQLMTAPLAIAIDALTFVASALSMLAIRTPIAQPAAPAIPDQPAPNIRREIRQGLRVVFDHPVLRTLAIAGGLNRFFGSMVGTLYTLYVVRVLGLSPAALGVLIASGGIGALTGALLAGRLARRRGIGRTLTLALLIAALSSILTPLAGSLPAGTPVLVLLALPILSQLVSDAASAVYAVNEMTLRQSLIDPRLLGRAGATINLLAEIAVPVGGLIAGGLAATLGTRWVMWLPVTGWLLVALWVSRSVVREAVVNPQAVG